ncbi:MAG: signal transduction histidine kinase [Candidatus Taylorbacteria bacterium]|nr:signal transduction histidine kinase [Candidatus Taylorbacteria bacterium]
MSPTPEGLNYKRLFETTRIGILVLDAKTRVITEANPFIEKLSGHGKKQLIGKKISELRVFNKNFTGKRIFDDLRRSDEAFYEHLELVPKTGPKKTVEVSTHAFKANGKTMIQCLIRDLTEKRAVQQELFESNQRLEALMNALPVGVTFSLDPECKRIEANPYMREKMEMGPDTQITVTDKDTLVVGHTYRHIRDGKRLKPKELTLQRAIAENRLVGPIEAEVELPSGKRWLAEAYGAPIHDRLGEVIGAVAVNLDLTERKKAEEAGKLALIVKQEQEKIGFITDATHELRTPLAIIRGNVDLALQKKTDPKEALRAINVEVLNLTDILSDLSLLTTKEGDFRKNVRSHTVEVASVVKEVARRHKGMASKKNISIETAAIPQSKIVGDEYYLERLFTNIVTNAISYGKEGGHIRISGAIEKDRLNIVVEDDGIGIEEKDLPHIFERFYRGEKSRSKDFGGSGLGLAIVKWIAEAHEGSVEARSILGKGSAFTISFPLPKKGQIK